jgi:hypothetical protein
MYAGWEVGVALEHAIFLTKRPYTRIAKPSIANWNTPYINHSTKKASLLPELVAQLWREVWKQLVCASRGSSHRSTLEMKPTLRSLIR